MNSKLERHWIHFCAGKIFFTTENKVIFLSLDKLKICYFKSLLLILKIKKYIINLLNVIDRSKFAKRDY